jgi:hypothetical protein
VLVNKTGDKLMWEIKIETRDGRERLYGSSLLGGMFTGFKIIIYQGYLGVWTWDFYRGMRICSGEGKENPNQSAIICTHTVLFVLSHLRKGVVMINLDILFLLLPFHEQVMLID